MANVLVWADIPVKNMARARAFYEKLLGSPIDEIPGTDGKVALLMQPGTGDPMDAAADLAADAITEPSTTAGPVIYLSAMGDLDGMLERAVEGGGQIWRPKQNMGEMGGWLAWIVDTEGNLIGLQQPLAEPVSG